MLFLNSCSNQISTRLWQLHFGFTFVCCLIRGPSHADAGDVTTLRSEGNPPYMFQIVTTALLSIICILLLVVFVVMVKCIRGESEI